MVKRFRRAFLTFTRAPFVMGAFGGVPAAALLDENNDALLDENNDYLLDESG